MTRSDTWRQSAGGHSQLTKGESNLRNVCHDSCDVTAVLPKFKLIELIVLGDNSLCEAEATRH